MNSITTPAFHVRGWQGAPFTPPATLRLGELVREQVPAGVLNIISGGDALGPWISAHPGIVMPDVDVETVAPAEGLLECTVPQTVSMKRAAVPAWP